MRGIALLGVVFLGTACASNLTTLHVPGSGDYTLGFVGPLFPESPCPSNTLLLSRDDETIFGIVECPGGRGVMVYSAAGVQFIIWDRDADGYFDWFSYTSFDNAGKELSDTQDCNLDGQPDFRHSYTPDSGEVWLDGSWFEVQREGDFRFVSRDGERVPLSEAMAHCPRKDGRPTSR